MDKFLFIGDSLTYGYDVPKSLGWVALLQKRWQMEGKQIEVENRGVNGDTLQGILNRLESVQSNEYQSIFVMGGSNDILMGREGHDCFEKIQSIYTFIRNTWPQAKIFIGVPMENIVDDGHFNKAIESYRQLLFTTYESLDVTLLDFYTVLREQLLKGEIVYAGDVHPNEKGYQLMADYAARVI